MSDKRYIMLPHKRGQHSRKKNSDLHNQNRKLNRIYRKETISENSRCDILAC